MYKYRITKYNPAYRDKKGTYTKEEWTSVSDIGKKYASSFTAREYIKTENLYIDAIENIINNVKCDNIYINKLETPYTIQNIIDLEEKYDLKNYYYADIKLFSEIHNNMILDKTQSCDLARMILREYIWCDLVIDHYKRISFGYDYYMYFFSDNDSTDLLKKSISEGMYFEIMQ